LTVNTGMNNIPEQFNFVDQLFKQADLSRLAVIDNTTTYTYAELQDQVKRLANWLVHLGVQPEQRVAIVLKDSAETAALLLATVYAGMVAVPLDPRAKVSSLLYCINHSECKVVIKEDDLDLPGIQSIDRSLIKYTHDSISAYASHRDSACIFMYTSGTTGHPKAVVHRHATPYIIGTVTGPWVGYHSEHRTFATAKLFYSFGMFNLWNTLFANACVVLTPGIFIPSSIAKLLIEHKVSLTVSIPVLYSKLSEQNLAGNSLQHSLSGADRLTQTIYNKWLDATGVQLRNLYGSTEIAAACLYNSGDSPLHSIGKPVPGHEIDIRDQHLFIKSPTAGLFYWHDKYWSERQFGEWMPTGDIVEMDKQGNLYFLGRQSDVVKVNGQFVDLAAIEQALLTLPGIQETVVVGKTDANGHAQLKAYIVPHPDHTVTWEQVKPFVKEYAVIEQMPRTDNGKIQRYKLREQM
jgi:benzoate-CoA ligase